MVSIDIVVVDVADDDPLSIEAPSAPAAAAAAAGPGDRA